MSNLRHSQFFSTLIFMPTRIRDFQNRLAMKQEIIKRKLIDNAIELSGSPLDCIRIKMKRNDEGDILSHIIEKADIVSVDFPMLKDIPYRKIRQNIGDDKYIYQITSLVSMPQTEDYEIRIPHKFDVDIDDIIIRVMLDPDVGAVSVLCLHILETLGTFGTQMLISTKYKCTIYNDPIPEKVLEVIKIMAKRRLNIQF